MNIKDYLHLYLGCTVEITNNHIGKAGLVKSTRRGTFIGFADYHRLQSRIGFRAGPEGRVSTFFIKPILRPLSDMTKEENNEHESLQTNHGEVGCGCIGTLKVDNGNSIAYLLSKHFDLFGLIEAGLAIDATKLTTAKQPVMKERDDFEPRNSNSDCSPVASHSVEDNNSIEQSEIWEDIITEAIYYGKDDLSQAERSLSKKYHISKK